MEFKKVTQYPIEIKSTHNAGFIVTVGCCTVCYSSVRTLLSDLEGFLNSPVEVIKKYNEQFGGTVSGGQIQGGSLATIATTSGVYR